MIRSTWAVPILLGLVTLVGLIAALAGQGPADWLSWIGLGLPIAAVAWAMGAQRS